MPIELENALWIIGGMIAVVYSFIDGRKNYEALRGKDIGENYVVWSIMISQIAIVISGGIFLVGTLIRWVFSL